MKVSMKRTLYVQNVVEYCNDEGLMNLASEKEWNYIKYCLGCNVCGRYMTVNVTPEILLNVAETILMYSTRNTLDIRDILNGLDMYIFNTYIIH